MLSGLVFVRGRRSVTEAMSRAVLIDRSLLDRGRSRVVELLALRCNRRAVICIKIGRFADMRVFSESSTGAKGNGNGSKSKLLHFHNPSEAFCGQMVTFGFAQMHWNKPPLRMA